MLRSFLNTMETSAGWLPGNFDIRPQTIRTLRKAGLSGVLLNSLYSEHGYWSKMGNQKRMRYDNEGRLVSFGKLQSININSPIDPRSEMCYQYRCGWDTGVSFIHFIRTRTQSTYFCINYPYNAYQRLQRAFEKQPDIAHRDFFLDTLVADDSLKQWQFEIGHRRDSLQQYVCTNNKSITYQSLRVL